MILKEKTTFAIQDYLNEQLVVAHTNQNKQGGDYMQVYLSLYSVPFSSCNLNRSQ